MSIKADQTLDKLNAKIEELQTELVSNGQEIERLKARQGQLQNDINHYKIWAQRLQEILELYLEHTKNRPDILLKEMLDTQAAMIAEMAGVTQIAPETAAPEAEPSRKRGRPRRVETEPEPSRRKKWFAGINPMTKKILSCAIGQQSRPAQSIEEALYMTYGENWANERIIARIAGGKYAGKITLGEDVANPKSSMVIGGLRAAGPPLKAIKEGKIKERDAARLAWDAYMDMDAGNRWHIVSATLHKWGVLDQEEA